MSFVERLLTFSFTLQKGTFAESGTNSVEVSGLRASVSISRTGNIRDAAEMEIYGLTSSVQKQLCTLGMRVRLVPFNTVTVKAGDVTNGMKLAFTGQIINAWTDFTAMPQVPFRATAQTAYYNAVSTAAPNSYAAPAPVSTIMQDYAKQLGYGFQNSGVNSVLSCPNYSGSTYSQLEACARDAGIGFTLDAREGVLAIWPRDGSRTGGSIPVVSASTGMVGFPSFTAEGVAVKAIYNPDFSCGKQIQIKTSAPIVQPANGVWTAFQIDDRLESLVPQGEWFSTVKCYNQLTGGSPLATE